MRKKNVFLLYTIFLLTLFFMCHTEIKAKEVISKSDKLVEYSGNEKKYVIPDNVRVIKKNAFKNAKKLRVLVLGKNVKKIEEGAIGSAKNLRKILVSKKNKKYSAYKGSLYSRNKKIFYASPNKMKKLVLSDKCKTFNTDSLGENIEALVIGKNVDNIYSGSEDNVIGSTLMKLKKITVSKNNKTYFSRDNVLFGYYKDGITNNTNVIEKIRLIKYPSADIREEYIISNDVNCLVSGAFEYACINKLVVPDSVERYDYYSFADCMAESIIFTGKINREIFGLYFKSCDNLKEISFTENNEFVPKNSLEWLPEGVQVTFVDSGI